jgi:hypothetical protein
VQTAVAEAVTDDSELSPEIIAQLLAMEKAALGIATPVAPAVRVVPPALQTSQSEVASDLSEMELAHLMALADGAVPSPPAVRATIAVAAPAAVMTTSTVECADDFVLTEEALAQLLELERKALAGGSSTPARASAAPAIARTSSVEASRDMSVVARAGQTAPSSANAEGPLLCMRLVALDVLDYHDRRVREVRAYQPGSIVRSGDSARNVGAGGGSSSGAVDAAASTGEDLVIVELVEDW